jgi:hypothetical protein
VGKIPVTDLAKVYPLIYMTQIKKAGQLALLREEAAYLGIAAVYLLLEGYRITLVCRDTFINREDRRYHSNRTGVSCATAAFSYYGISPFWIAGFRGSKLK